MKVIDAVLLIVAAFGLPLFVAIWQQSWCAGLATLCVLILIRNYIP